MQVIYQTGLEGNICDPSLLGGQDWSITSCGRMLLGILNIWFYVLSTKIMKSRSV